MIPENASEDEAAAIVAALSAYLEKEGDADGPPTWHGRRWAFAGRTEALQGRAARVPTDAPTDPWTAASRTGRMP